MKRMKRILSLFLALVMCLSMVNLTVFAVGDDAEPAEETVKEVYTCDKEEHQHGDDCYEEQIVKTLVCEDEEHEHTDECNETELVCGLEKSEGAHAHSDDCYKTETKTVEEQVLICEQEESEPTEASEGHKHDEDCYKVSETKELTCEQEESEGTEATEDAEAVPGHTHTEECYTVTETKELICGQEESDPVEASEGHTHGEECYETKTKTVEEQVLTCELEESEGHQHTEDCYKTEKVLVCELEEHTHTLECVGAFAELVQGLEAFSPKLEVFQEEYFADLGEDAFDEYGDLTEEAMTAFTQAVAAELGEEFNTLIDLYKTIPERFAEEPAYTETVGTLANLAGLLGGDLDSGVQTLDVSKGALTAADLNGKTVTLTNNVTVNGTINLTQNSTLNLNSYTVTYKGNTGSVFHVKSGTLTLNGAGTITGGKGTNVKWDEIVDRDQTNGEPAGGAVLVDSGAAFTMNGGTITGNKATWGGGIAVARGGKLNIYGGSITSNTATSGPNDSLLGAATGKYGGGGGIFCAGDGLINPTNGNITITGNKTGTVNDLGGGGVFIESKGTMKIYNAVVTGNTAQGQGGGVAGCLHGKVSNISPQTAAIYDNTAQNAKCVTRLSLIDHNDWWWGKKGVTKANDYFCAGYSVVGKVSMNGGDAKWTGWQATSDSSGVSQASGDPIVVKGVTGLSVGSGNTVAAKANSFAGNKVTISGNTSLMHGGGIGCNGTLSFGEESFSYSTSTISIKASKSVTGAVGNDGAKNGFTFQLLKGNDVIATATSNKEGAISFNNLSTAMLFGESTTSGNVSVTLTLKEIAGNKVGMTYDTTPRKITINAMRTERRVDISTGSGGIDVVSHVFSDTLTSATVSQGTATVSGTTVTLNGTANFENKMTYTQLTVNKVWDNKGMAQPESVQVQLYQGDTKYGNPVTLNASNSWTHTWENLSKDYTWTAKEVNVPDGYTDSTKTTGNINDGFTTTITNTRKLNNLTVTKTVRVDTNGGAYSDTNLKTNNEFTIQVTLGDGSVPATGNEYVANGKYTFTLKDGASATISNIPYGTPYAVVELDKDNMPKQDGKYEYGYVSGDSNGNLNSAAAVTVTNSLKEYGNLQIDKTVVSPTKLEDNEKFVFTVELKDANNNPVTIDVTSINGVEAVSGETGKYKVTIQGSAFEGEETASVTIPGIPAGTKWTVTEVLAEAPDYDLKDNKNDLKGSISATEISKAEFTDVRKTASLSVSKKVDWNETSVAPDLENDEFTIVVELGNGSVTVVNPIKNEDGTYKFVENGKYTFKLKAGTANGVAGEAVTISGIPTKTPYKVTETAIPTIDDPNVTDINGNPLKLPKPYTNTNKDELAKGGTLGENGAQVEVQNHYYERKLTSVTVKKEWTDGENFRPESVSYVLYQGDTLYSGPLTSDESLDYGYTWDKLPMYKGDGKEAYVYTVKEVTVNYPKTDGKYTADRNDGGIIRVRNPENKTADGVAEIVGGWRVSVGEAKKDDKGNTTYTITNKWLGKEDAVKASITIHKVDADDNAISIPGVWFTLTRDDGNTVAPNIPFTDQNGTITFTGLTEGKYTLKETVIHAGYLDSNKDRTWEITIGRGNNLQSVEEKDNPAGKNTWSWTDAEGTKLPDKDGVLSWTANEDCLGGTLTITNEIIKGSISITKKVDLKDVQNPGTVPDEKEFTFDVYAEEVFGLEKGAKVGTLTVKNGETKSLSNLRYGTYLIVESGSTALDGYAYDGLTIEGTVGSTTFNDQNAYRVMVTENSTTYAVTATNHYTRDTGSLTISKKVEGLSEDAYKDKEFTFTVKGPADVDGTYGEVEFKNGEATVIVKGATSVTIEGLPTGQYTVVEDETKASVSGYNLRVSVISPVDVTKDSEAVSTVTNTYTFIPRSNSTSLTVRKVWKGDGDIERPASVSVQLLRDGEPYGDVETLSASNSWRRTWTGLDKKYDWSVDEVDVPEGYTREVTKSGTTYTITNTYSEPDIPDEPTPLNSVLSVSKVWVGDAGAKRPDSVTVQLFKDGEVSETVTLNDANGWSWSRVLSKEELTSQWTAGEVNVPEGYTSSVSVGSDGTSFTVTNTFTTTPEKPDEPETPDIPDEETPKTDLPDEPVEVPDEQPPLVDLPDEQPPLVEVPEYIPLIPAEPEVEIPEDPVPMVGIPQTGDFSMVWYVTALLSALGLAVLTLKKREDEEG